MPFCPNCGNEMPFNSDCCPHCNQRFKIEKLPSRQENYSFSDFIRELESSFPDRIIDRSRWDHQRWDGYVAGYCKKYNCTPKDFFTAFNFVVKSNRITNGFENENVSRIRCQRCGKMTPSVGKFCEYCGEKFNRLPANVDDNTFSNEKFCMYCGNKISLNATICNHCGCPVESRKSVPKKTEAVRVSYKDDGKKLIRGEAFHKIPLISALICGIFGLPLLFAYIDSYGIVSWAVEELFLDPEVFVLKRGLYNSSFLSLLFLTAAIVFLIIGCIRKGKPPVNRYGLQIQPVHSEIVKRRSELSLIFGIFSLFLTIFAIPALILSLSAIHENNENFNKKNKAGYILGFIDVCFGILAGTFVINIIKII